MKMDIHDFEVTGIQISGGDSFFLNLFDPQYSISYVLKFVNVQKLYVEGLSLQNIVLDFNVYTRPSGDFGFNRVCGMLDLDMAAAELILEKGSLLLIEASSGAEIACILSDCGVPDLLRTSD